MRRTRRRARRPQLRRRHRVHAWRSPGLTQLLQLRQLEAPLAGLLDRLIDLVQVAVLTLHRPLSLASVLVLGALLVSR